MTKNFLLCISLTFFCSMSPMNLCEQKTSSIEQVDGNSSNLKQHHQKATSKLNNEQIDKHVSLLAQAMLNKKSLLWDLD